MAKRQKLDVDAERQKLDEEIATVLQGIFSPRRNPDADKLIVEHLKSHLRFGSIGCEHVISVRGLVEWLRIKTKTVEEIAEFLTETYVVWGHYEALPSFPEEALRAGLVIIIRKQPFVACRKF